MKQKGFTLVELSLVILISTMLLAFKFSQMQGDLESDLARAQGEQLKVLNEGAYSYALANFQAVVNDTPVPGVVAARAPTPAELKALGFLRGGFREQSFFGSGYGIIFDKFPPACVTNCSITGLTYLDQPLLIAGDLSGSVLGEAANTIGADGGFSKVLGGNILGKAGGWNATNPVVGAPAGILAVRNGAGSAMDFSSYLKRDGSMPMTGSLEMGGNTITGIRTETSGAACVNAGELAQDADGKILSCQSGTWQQQGGGSAYWKDPVSTAAALPVCDVASSGQARIVMTPTIGSGSRAYVCNGAAWEGVASDDSGNMSLSGTFTTGKARVADVETESAVCTTNGLMAVNASNLLMSCQGGRWAKVGGITAYGGTFLVRGGWSPGCVTVNIRTGACSCPNGYYARQGAMGAYFHAAPWDSYYQGYFCEK